MPGAARDYPNPGGRHTAGLPTSQPLVAQTRASASCTSASASRPGGRQLKSTGHRHRRQQPQTQTYRRRRRRGRPRRRRGPRRRARPGSGSRCQSRGTAGGKWRGTDAQNVGTCVLQMWEQRAAQQPPSPQATAPASSAARPHTPPRHPQSRPAHSQPAAASAQTPGTCGCLRPTPSAAQTSCSPQSGPW